MHHLITATFAQPIYQQVVSIKTETVVVCWLSWQRDGSGIGGMSAFNSISLILLIAMRDILVCISSWVGDLINFIKNLSLIKKKH